eukprot:GGOE01042394.1.p1 GENE.GGOE01042394.1~~GGOE01042394.1.p1  ORF type:complete len:240 (-),score=24.69 GGOE01042394.1:232-879(-)
MAAAGHAIKLLYLQNGRDVLATITQVVDQLNEEGADVGLAVSPTMDCIHIMDLRAPQMANGSPRTCPPNYSTNDNLYFAEGSRRNPNHTLTTMQASSGPTAEEVLDGQTRSLFKAWGVRHRPHLENQARNNMVAGNQHPSSPGTSARLPNSARSADQTAQTPSGRAQGGHTFLPPYHKRYGYYRTFGAAGHGASTSATHNFPHGEEPTPGRIHTP